MTTDTITVSRADLKELAKKWRVQGSMIDHSHADELESILSRATPQCPHCDGTGDVHRADGEWLGKCDSCTTPRQISDDLSEIEEVATSLGDDAEVVRRQLGPDNEISENTERAAQLLESLPHHAAKVPDAFNWYTAPLTANAVCDLAARFDCLANASCEPNRSKFFRAVDAMDELHAILSAEEVASAPECKEHAK